MTDKNDFTKKITTAPIYNHIQSPSLSLDSSDKANLSNKTQPDWQKWFQQVHNTVAETNYSGNPSQLLNSDFNFNRSIANPVTQADGSGAFFSEKWQVFGAANAAYTLTKANFTGNESDQTGSTTYVNVNVSAWNGGEFFFYQRFDGEQFLRRFQNRNIFMSTKLVNNGSETIVVKFVVNSFYDPEQDNFEKGVIHLAPGENYSSTHIVTQSVSPNSVGASPLVQFKFEFVDLPGGTADFDLIYIKGEIADSPTPLLIDHFLEETRIDNS